MIHDNMAVKAWAITPNDDNDLTTQATGLWVGVSGDLKVILVGDTVAVTFKGAVGAMPINVKRVLATGTTATDILGMR